MLEPQQEVVALPQQKLFLFDLVGYEWHDNEVMRFHADPARIKIASSPARTSKSFATAHDALLDSDPHRGRGIFDPGINPIHGIASNPFAESQNIWIIAPNFDLAKEYDYLWQLLKIRYRALGLHELYDIGTAENQPKQGRMQLEMIWKQRRKDGGQVRTVITVKTAANEQSLQSEQVALCILSEAARLQSKVWRKYLSTRSERAIWATTPGQEAIWIYNELERAKQYPHLGVRGFQFHPYANPRYHYSIYWEEHQKAESRMLGRIETVPADISQRPAVNNGHNCFDPSVMCAAAMESDFAEQYLGQWTFARNRVVPIRVKEGLRGEPSHLIDFDPEWMQHAKVYVAYDYGFSDAAVCGFWFVAPSGHVILRRCIYERCMTTPELVKKTREEWDWCRRKFHIDRPRADVYLGDPRKPEVAAQLAQAGISIAELNKNRMADRQASHRALMDLLAIDPATGMPWLRVHTDCSAVINEWQELRRDENVRNEDAPSALKGADHAYDMARYFAGSGPRPFSQAVERPFRSVKQRILLNKKRIRTVPPVSGWSGKSMSGDPLNA